jgi:hypothetical protein
MNEPNKEEVERLIEMYRQREAARIKNGPCLPRVTPEMMKARRELTEKIFGPLNEKPKISPKP